MSADLAPDQLRQIVDRILRLKAEQDETAGLIREIYAEAKANGFDKTVLGAVVAHLRKVEKSPDKAAEAQELFDLYLARYEGGPHTRTHTHEVAA